MYLLQRVTYNEEIVTQKFRTSLTLNGYLDSDKMKNGNRQYINNIQHTVKTI